MKIDVVIIKQLQCQLEKSNQRSFEELYRLFFPRLFNFAMLYVHTKEVAEEIVNDVMVKIWQTRDSIATIDNLETYLFVSVRNHSLNYLKKYSNYHVVVEPGSGMAEVISVNNPGRDLEWKEINFKLNMAVEQLPDQCRTVFKLIKEEGFKYKQVAEILGLSPRTVETQLFRAIKKLGVIVNSFIEKPSGSKNSQEPLIGLLLIIFPCIQCVL